MQRRKKLGKILCELGFISEEELKKALHRQKNTSPHRQIGSILIEMGFLSERQLAQGLAVQFKLPFVDLKKELPLSAVARSLSETKARQSRALVFDQVDRSYRVAVADPTNISLLDNLRGYLGRSVEIFVGVPSEIKDMIDFVYSGKDEEKVTELADQIIHEAIRRKASDIHLEPGMEKLMVRYRVDGVLENAFSISKNVHPFLISRLKILAGMDIGEKRRPQDGRVKIDRGGEWDLRVSTLPAYQGEKMAIRVLDRLTIPEMEYLGLEVKQENRLREILNLRNGIFLVVGPTGSGKTTTLFSMLKELQGKNLNITTAEDPIEYILPAVNQIQVNPKIGLNFAALLRSILRQDPDVIMLGEIRDEETAGIAINAALTGHLVLSTLHTHNAPSALIRLLEMGIEPYLVSSTVIGIMGQRLVRKFCPDCFPKKESNDLRTVSYWERMDRVGEKTGCSSCYASGYRGRTAIAEVLIPDDNLREKVVQKEPGVNLKKAAAGIMEESLKEAGLKKVERGETSLEEVLRVVRGG